MVSLNWHKEQTFFKNLKNLDFVDLSFKIEFFIFVGFILEFSIFHFLFWKMVLYSSFIFHLFFWAEIS